MPQPDTHEDRYYVKESTGYRIKPGSNQAGNASAMTEVLVLDRDYCHRVVWSTYAGQARLDGPRAEAHRLCRQWNAEDRADAA